MFYDKEGKIVKHRYRVEVGIITTYKIKGRKKVFIKIGYPGRLMPYSHFIWIASGKTIPKGYLIHHKDRNPENNKIKNLELVSRQEHASLHFKDNKHCFECKHFKKLKGTGKLKRREGLRGFCSIKNKKISSLNKKCKYFKKGRFIAPLMFCKKCGRKEGKHFCNGYCGNCYRKYGRRKIRCKICKQIKVLSAKGMCKPCYTRALRQSKKRKKV